MPKKTYTTGNLEAILKELAAMQNKDPYAIDSSSVNYNQTSEMKDTDVELRGTHLKGKNIAVVASGSVAAVRTFDLARELERYGAKVNIFPTQEALRFIGKDALEWASDDIIEHLSSKAEHVDNYDAYIVAPATLDIISDMAGASAGKPASTLLASALGKHCTDGTPILIAPAMHNYLWDNPEFQKNLKSLENYGIKIAGPKLIDGKANLEDIDKITAYTIRELSNGPLKGKKVVVNAGPARAPVDDVRSITNFATGGFGIEIAKELYLQGAEVELIYGPGGLEVPDWLKPIRVTTYQEMYDETMDKTEDCDLFIATAAIPDFETVKSEGKIKSGENLTIHLKPTRKLISDIREKRPELLMVTYKLEYKTLDALHAAQERLKDYELVFANSLEEMDMAPQDIHPGYILEQDGTITRVNGTKTDDARLLLNVIENYYMERSPQTSVFDFGFNEMKVPEKIHNSEKLGKTPLQKLLLELN